MRGTCTQCANRKEDGYDPADQSSGDLRPDQTFCVPTVTSSRPLGRRPDTRGVHTTPAPVRLDALVRVDQPRAQPQALQCRVNGELAEDSRAWLADIIDQPDGERRPDVRVVQTANTPSALSAGRTTAE